MLSKRIFTILLLTTSLSSFSQSEKIVGEYFRELGNEKHHIEYKLNLNQDGTFTFHSITNIELPPQKVEKYGKGTWKSDGKLVSFFTDNGKDIDEKHALDFGDSRARFITKPARDKTDRIIKTRLQFFESKIFWIERLKIFKI
jgi:hypothetical protein